MGSPAFKPSWPSGFHSKFCLQVIHIWEGATVSWNKTIVSRRHVCLIPECTIQGVSDSAPENTHWAAKNTLAGRVQGRPACNVPCSFHPGEKGQRETLPGVTSCSGSTSLDHFLQCWCPDALLGSQSDCGLGATEPHSSHEVTLASCRLQLSTHCDWGGLKDTQQQVLPDFKATGHVC